MFIINRNPGTTFRHITTRPSQVRTAATITSQGRREGTITSQGKREGTIADAFASLSGQTFEALEPRFATVKADLVKGNEEAIKASWDRLLARLRQEVLTIKELGSRVVPQIDFSDIHRPSEQFCHEYRKRGCAVIRGVIAPNKVLEMKEELKQYIMANPSTKAFPADSPQVYELYWSPAQVKARAHPNLLRAQRFLLSFWHSKDPKALVSAHPISYADRLRMRQPGDTNFALGPHVDGGSCERWENQGYGKGKVYEKIWQGKWEEYDPWESSSRLSVESDLYQGQGACSAFRMNQGWLGMSDTSAFEGTLLVNPLLQLATAYFLLRPFFTAKALPPASSTITREVEHLHMSRYLSPENWMLESPSSSWLQGANLGRGQELNCLLHPHLELPSTMVHVPTVRPGDYVVWHCDSIHAVDNIHQGSTDSSVMYIPACPLTENNAKYLVRQRKCFTEGVPSPDFPGGVGESGHVGVAKVINVTKAGGEEALRAMGLTPFIGRYGDTRSELEIMERANKILGFG